MIKNIKIDRYRSYQVTNTGLFNNLLKLMANNLNLNYNFERTSPRTGILSTSYLLLNTEGKPSIPALWLVSSTYTLVSIFSIILSLRYLSLSNLTVLAFF